MTTATYTRWAGLLCSLLLLTACTFKSEADAQFGDQNFKTAVALIELYKLRHGSYPETLGDITYAGQWDAMALNAVRYQRIGNGYELDIARGWVGRPALSYPADFWQGLGIVSSNVGGMPNAAPH